MPVKYPHMRPKEVPIWERCLKAEVLKPIRIDYDVHLGKGAPIDPAWPEWLKKVVEATSRKRADVVLETRDELWIIEVKERIGFSALGQLLGYGVLLLDEWRPRKPVRLACVCSELSYDLEPVLEEFGIVVWVV